MTAGDSYRDKDVDQLLAICKERRIPTGTARPFQTTLVRLLIRYDSDMERFRKFAQQLEVEIPKEMGPKEAQLFLEPHALERLTADGYFVHGQVSTRSYTFHSQKHVLTGGQTTRADHLQVTTKQDAITTTSREIAINVMDIFSRIYRDTQA